MDDTINGHEYVDLGLSVKWATCNVGADSPTDDGNYYAWGEIKTKPEYTINNSATWEKDMGDIAGNPNYDAARTNWGSSWRLPTYKEIQELIDNCTTEWVSRNGVNGKLFTSKKNGNSIFLPATGYRCGSLNGCTGERGYYWCSLPDESNTQNACYLSFRNGSLGWGWGRRFDGRSVRPVSG